MYAGILAQRDRDMGAGRPEHRGAGLVRLQAGHAAGQEHAVVEDEQREQSRKIDQVLFHRERT